MPGTVENTNAMKHGARSARAGFDLGEWGRKNRGMYQALKLARRTLERHVADAQGVVPLLKTVQINECLRWEAVARITQRLIANGENLQPDQVVSYLNTIGNATRNRNAILRTLLADAPAASDPWLLLDLERQQARQCDVAAPAGSRDLASPSDATAAASGVSDSEAIA